MTDCKKVFVDTAPFIYLIEKNEDHPQYFDKVKKFFDYGYQNNVEFVTSVITIEEYLVFPYRINGKEYIEIFEKLIEIFDFKIAVIDEIIAKEAAKIRAEYRAFKPMDALQLSVAYIKECDLFLTNDRQLKQFKKVKCVTVDELV